MPKTFYTFAQVGLNTTKVVCDVLCPCENENVYECNESVYECNEALLIESCCDLWILVHILCCFCFLFCVSV